MVISTNSVPSKSEFENLLSNTIDGLKSDSKKSPKFFLSLGGQKLESIVVDIMKLKSKDTPFENSIELVSGQRFPDIVAKRYYGVEVKTTKTNHWKSTGSSIAEGTRVEGVERIFMLFGKLCNPIDFRCKPYEDCLSEVVVTHSPRYLIDMEIPNGNTIFDKIKVPYDKLRKQEFPIETILKYYRKQLKPGESTWWLGQEPQNAPSLIIRLWKNLSAIEKYNYRLKGFSFFPEVISRKSDKYNKFAIWLSTKEGIVCPNVRDIFSAGGQEDYSINGRRYRNIPKILINLFNDSYQLYSVIKDTSSKTLSDYWELSVNERNKFEIWVNLIQENAKTIYDDYLPILEIINYEISKCHKSPKRR